MSVYRLPAGALLLTGTALEACRYAVAVAQRARARNGLPPSTQLAQLGEALAAAGQTDSPAEPAGLLGCSERKARRLAPQLGGRLTGGRWLLDRVAVTEHLEGVNP